MTQQQQNLINAVLSLPTERLPLVAAFVEKLKLEAPPATGAGDVATDPFVGMWKDREDLQDSNAWVRNLRKSEW
ncbi:MAG: hypothetical protein HYX68_12805 [Planctomycetes bacterium]|nr:hypothetical protein [Planctomycetota bacterium]